MAFAAEHGAKRASQLTGVPASTIRAWKSRESQPGDAPVSSSQAAAVQIGGSSEDLVRMGQAMVRTAEKARRAAEKAIRDGKSTGVKDLAIASGVLLDQAGKLEAAAERLRVADVEVTEAQGRRVGIVLRLYFAAVGADRLLEDAVGVRLLQECLRASREVPDELERAPSRAAVRAFAGQVLDPGTVAAARERLRADSGADGVPALPAPDGDVVDAEVVDDGQC